MVGRFPGHWHLPLAVVLLFLLRKHRPLPASGLLKYAPAVVPLLFVSPNASRRKPSQAFLDVAGMVSRGVTVAVCAGSLLTSATVARRQASL